jgi:hypothetical protein
MMCLPCYLRTSLYLLLTRFEEQATGALKREHEIMHTNNSAKSLGIDLRKKVAKLSMKIE